MAKDPAFLFYPGDYLRDTQCLSESVQVAYDRIMCEHMRNICITYEQLNFFTKRLGESEKSELLHVLTEVDGGYQIGWVAESICKRKDYSESRRKNRSSSKKDMLKTSSSYDSHMENENEDVNESVTKDESEKPKRERFQKPSFQEIESFMQQVNDTAGGIWKPDKITAEAKKYFNHYESNGWKVGRNPMKDWKAAVRNWMNNANKFSNDNDTRKQKQQSDLDRYRAANKERFVSALGQQPAGVGNEPG